MKKFLLSPAIILAAVLAPICSMAHAQELWIACQGLPGCRPGWEEHFTDVINLLLSRLPAYVYAMAVVVIMYGGALILLSAGESDRVTKGKNAIIWAIIGIFVTQFAATFVGFIKQEVLTRDSGPDLVLSIVRTLGGSIFDLLYVALIGVAIYCGMRMVLSFGKDDEFNKSKTGLFWAAVGAIIINLADAIAKAFSTL